MVAELADLVGVGAAQHVDQVRGAETLAAAVDTAQRLACDLGRIPGAHRLQAVVAVAAHAGAVAAGLAFTNILLAERGQQCLPSAAGGFAIAQQLVQLAPLQRLALVAGFALLDHLPQQHHVTQAIAHPGLGRFAVASGAAGFLVIALDRLGQVQVGDEAHVGLVDAHAEGDGGAHHDAVLAQEAALVVGAHLHRQSGVIGQGGDAVAGEEVGGFLDLAPRQAVHDARLAGVTGEEIEQLSARIVLVCDAVADVGPVEGAEEALRILQRQALGDLAPGRWIGAGGQGDARHLRPALVEHGQFAILGAEVVAPL